MQQAIDTGSLLDEAKDDMAALTAAAESHDKLAFVELVHQIDWSQKSASEYVQAVYLTLGMGAHLLARKLATQGAKLHPDHEELQKMARVLSPPRFVEALPPSSSARANQAWIRDHADEYRGQWVAIRAGEFLAAGKAAREVWDRLEDTHNVLLTKIG